MLASWLRMATGSISSLSFPDYDDANGSTVSFPADVQAGDLLIGATNTDLDTTFRGASGFTSAKFFSNSGSSALCYKIADGTETGSIGGFTNVSTPFVEAVVVLRFNKAITGVSVGDTDGARYPGAVTGVALAGAASDDTKARLAIMLFASSGTFANADISFTGSGFTPATYGSTSNLKTRIKLWPAGVAGENLTAGMDDMGTDNAVWGAILELT